MNNLKQILLAATLACIANANDANVTTTTFGIQSWNMNHINYWIVPGIVAGLAVFIGVILIFLFALCQLMSVQSPSFFPDKSIDFGKIEEVE